MVLGYRALGFGALMAFGGVGLPPSRDVVWFDVLQGLGVDDALAKGLLGGGAEVLSMARLGADCFWMLLLDLPESTARIHQSALMERRRNMFAFGDPVLRSHMITSIA